MPNVNIEVLEAAAKYLDLRLLSLEYLCNRHYPDMPKKLIVYNKHVITTIRILAALQNHKMQGCLARELSTETDVCVSRLYSYLSFLENSYIIRSQREDGLKRYFIS